MLWVSFTELGDLRGKLAALEGALRIALIWIPVIMLTEVRDEHHTRCNIPFLLCFIHSLECRYCRMVSGLYNSSVKLHELAKAYTNTTTVILTSSLPPAWVTKFLSKPMSSILGLSQDWTISFALQQFDFVLPRASHYNVLISLVFACIVEESVGSTPHSKKSSSVFHV